MKTNTNLILDVDAELEPLSVEEAKAYLKIDGNLEDDQIAMLVKSARKVVEGEIGRPIGVQTFELGLEQFPYCGVIEISRSPVVSVLSIQYQLQDLSWVTLFDTEVSPEVTDTENRTVVDTASLPGRVHLRSRFSWPTDVLAEGLPVRVKFTAGLSVNIDNLLTLIGMATAYMYEHRDEEGGEGVRAFVRKMGGLSDSCLVPEMW